MAKARETGNVLGRDNMGYPQNELERGYSDTVLQKWRKIRISTKMAVLGVLCFGGDSP